jgi:hypothetical protein
MPGGLSLFRRPAVQAKIRERTAAAGWWNDGQRMSFVKRFTEWVLGIPAAGPGQGTAWRFEYDFPWPTWGLLLFCLGAAAYVVLVYRRDAAHLSRGVRFCLASLRLAALGVLLFMLSEAALSIERTGLPHAVVLLDVSGSMGTEDPPAASEAGTVVERVLSAAEFDKPTRLNIAKGVLLENNGELLRRLVQNHKLRLYTVAETESQLGKGEYLDAQQLDELLPEIRRLEPRGDQTRLGESLRRVLNTLRGTPPSAILVISDGITTDGEKLSAAARYARQKSVPLFTLAVGNADPIRDVELHNLLVDDVAFVDDPIRFSYTLTSRGFQGKRARVTLRREGESEVLAAVDVPLGDEGKPARLELTYTPRTIGEFDFVLEATPLPQEANTRNNRATRHISVRSERIRVLLADFVPRWEFRELKALLEREKTIELKTVLQDSDPEYVQEDLSALPHFPVTREELYRFDVIILGDVNLSYLSSSVLENLREAVRERGRGIMMIAGTYHNPLTFSGTVLEPLVPVELAGLRVPLPDELLTESFHPELTAEGLKGASFFRFADSERESQEVWNFLPGFFWLAETTALKPGAIAFATHPTKLAARGKVPVIAMQRFGAGKVIFQATDETWRWRFRTGDTYYGRYWVQAIRYLSRSKLLGTDATAELTVDRKIYRVGDQVNLRVRFIDEKQTPAADDGVTVIVERSGSRQIKATLSRVVESPTVFEGQLAQIAEGKYHAWVATPGFAQSPPADDFEVRPSERESRVLRADVPEMVQAAQTTHGKTYTIATAHRIAAEIPPGLPIAMEARPPITLWNHWLALSLFAALLCGEWILRKRKRLV